MIVSENNVLEARLANFYRWIEKQKDVGTTLTTAYSNRQKTTTHPISHYIKRIDFSQQS